MSGMHSLRRRMVIAFSLFAAAVSLIFALFCIVFLYVVEDRFFANILHEEAEHQQSHLLATGLPATPLRDFVTIYQSVAEMPEELRSQWLRTPRAKEFFGNQGRHYHLVRIEGDGQPLFIVGEVSRQLVVRPILGTIVQILVVLTLGILLVTIVIGYGLAYRATAPLMRLVSLLSSAEPGRLPAKFSQQYPNNEIGLLAGKLEKAMQRIRYFIERERLFTQDVSHELRTPAAVIRGATELMMQQDMSPLASAQLQRIQTACLQMEQTTNALLSLAREEAANGSPERITLLPLVETVVVQLAYLLEKKPVEVKVELSPDFTVLGYRVPVSILLSNLIGNAFSHTLHGIIRITAADSRLVISDTGPGIDPVLMNKVFEPHVKGDSSSGFGLGLSIARRLCDRFGMDLCIESEPMSGTRVVVSFK